MAHMFVMIYYKQLLDITVCALVVLVLLLRYVQVVRYFFYTFCTARCTLVQGSLAVTCLYTRMQCWCIVIT